MKTLLSTLAVFACVWSLSAQLISNFEGYDNGIEVMFRQPTFSGSTSGKLDTGLPNFSGVTNVFPAGNANSGANVYNAIFSFSASATTPWLRYTTYNTANVPNPTVDFTQTLKFDIHSDRPLYVALMLRETNSTQPIGGNGGASGSIEFVGGVTDNTSPAKGYLVPADTWTTLSFDIPYMPVVGLTGDGVLTSTTGKGVLEALDFVPQTGDSGTYNVYLDNFQVVPEPSVAALLGLGFLGWIARSRRQRA